MFKMIYTIYVNVVAEQTIISDAKKEEKILI